MSRNDGSAFNRRNLLIGAAAAAFVRPAIAQEAHPGLGLGRPHSDFLQTQVEEPRRVLGEKNSQPGVDAGTASYDAKGSKSTSGVFHYAPGWRFDKKHYVNSDQEFFVLDGEFTVDDITYKTGDYTYFPAGYEHKLMESKSGGAVFNFYEGEHLAFYEPVPAGMYVKEKLIKHIQSARIAWKGGTADDERRWGRTAQRKLLRNDRKTGESTWLLKVGPDKGDVRRPVVTNAAVEEMFVLDGDIATPRGVMKPGSYAWRIPGVALGPMGTKGGFVALIRSKGGALKPTFGESKPVVWDAPYQPLIDTPQKAWAFKPYDSKLKF